jgi:hypothetical protein
MAKPTLNIGTVHLLRGRRKGIAWDSKTESSGILRSVEDSQSCLANGGELIKFGVERGRSTRANLKVGICGEHGGDADSVKFCHKVGMDYVSCSPFRVPIARLAAAQAQIENPRKK